MSTETLEDFSTVESQALIAVYDNLLSAPRMVPIEGGPTADFIEALASRTYELSQSLGGAIPYTIIREVTENFIHARFQEIVISVLDHGNTIRFSDQGPGITDKLKAQEPGFTSATQPMKHYIRGVGSGLPIVKEYLGITHGSLVIEDNLERGAVITLSLRKPGEESSVLRSNAASIPSPSPYPDQISLTSNGGPAFSPTGAVSSEEPSERIVASTFTERERSLLQQLALAGPLGVSALAHACSLPLSSTHALLQKLEEAGYVTVDSQKKRQLTAAGQDLASKIL